MRLLTVPTGISVSGVIKPATLRGIARMRGILPPRRIISLTLRMFPLILSVVPLPLPCPLPPPDLLSILGPPPLLTEPASVEPVPLMSVQVHTPQSPNHVITEVIQESQEDAVSSIASLFSIAEDSVNEFSVDDSLSPSPLIPSPSPSLSISSFTSSSGNCSQSILKEIPIVSSDPMVEQIIVDVVNGPAASNIDGPVGSSVVGPAASNVNGPAASTIGGPAASSVDSPAVSNVVGPVACNVSNCSSKVISSKVTNKSKIPKPSGKSGPKSVVSSDSESEFRRPLAVSGEACSRSKSPAANIRSRLPLSPAGFHRLPSVAGSKPGRPR